MAAKYLWPDLDQQNWFNHQSLDILSWFDDDLWDGAVSATPMSLAATEGPDTVVINVNGNVVLAATEASDTVVINVNGNVVLNATEGTDTAAVNVNVNALLAVTEAADTMAATINGNVVLGATEGSDTAAATIISLVSLAVTEGPDTIAANVNVNALLAATEDPDTAAMAMQEDAAFSLAASEAADTCALVIEEAQSFARNFGGTRRRKLVKDPFFELESLMEELEFTEELEEEIHDIVQAHKELVAEPIDIPETTQGIANATKSYTELLSMITKAVMDYNEVATWNSEAYRVLTALNQARRKVQQEEEEVILLLTMEIL